MFIYICLAPFCFEFTKKLDNWNLEKFYLVLFLLWSFFILVICGRLWWFVVVCWWFVVVACFSNFVLQGIFFLRKTNLFGITISTEKLLFRRRYFYTASDFSEQLLLEKANSSKEVLFKNIYFFRKATFLKQLIFQESNIPQLTFPEEVLLHS